MENKLVSGVNDLETWCRQNNRLDLLEEWDYQKNDINPSEISKGSSKKVWWKDKLGHSWDVSAGNRTTNNSKCPYCCTPPRKILAGFNDISTTDPEIAKEWDYEKNKPLKIESISRCNNKKVWWICPKGHSYQNTSACRTVSNQGCPYCAGKKVLEGFNDLKSWCYKNGKERHINEWNYEKNTDIDPTMVTRGSHKKVWWKCTQGHEWQSMIKDKISDNLGCPYCGHQKLLVGVNDFATTQPGLLKEWNFDKNIIKPTEIVDGSNKLVWWKCVEGHEWQAKVNARVYSGIGCSKCSREHRTSFVEQAVFYYIHNAFPDAINSDNHLGMELDIYIPSRNIAIEYDGEAWHKIRESYDIRKNQLCIDNNIELIRIREPKLEKIDNCTVFVRKHSTILSTLSDVIVEVLEYLGATNNDVDVERDTPYILEQYSVKKNDNSLSVCFPEVAKQWHPTKNGNLTPDRVNKATRRKVWWLCPEGHEWEAVIGNRIKGSGCPICYMNKKSPRVQCVESEQIFMNVTEAAKWAGIDHKSRHMITSVCKGKQKTAGGYHWKYVD